MCENIHNNNNNNITNNSTYNVIVYILYNNYNVKFILLGARWIDNSHYALCH